MNSLFETQMNLFTKKNQPLEEILDWQKFGELRKLDNLHPVMYIQNYEVILDTQEEKKLVFQIQDSNSPLHYKRPPKLMIYFVNTFDSRTQTPLIISNIIFEIKSMPYWKESIDWSELKDAIAWNGKIKFPNDLVDDMLKIIELYYDETPEKA